MKLRRIIRIGTRASLLARTQSGHVLKALKLRHPEHRFELVFIKTRGDEFQSVELFKRSGVGVFTKAIEKELLRGSIDLAVHSLKDLPTDLPKGLVLAAIPRREAVGDALLSRRGYTLETLPAGSRVGTGSLRRKRQLNRFRPDVTAVDLRGNLDTRAGKVLKEKSLDAIIIAQAGIRRLRRFERHIRPLSPATWLPAIGQGALAVQARKDDAEVLRIARSLDHRPTRISCETERLFLRTLRGGCRIPLGFRCTLSSRRMHLSAELYAVDEDRCLSAATTCAVKDAPRFARLLAKRLLVMGGASILRRARS